MLGRQCLSLYFFLLCFAVVGTSNLQGEEPSLVDNGNKTNSNFTDRFIMSTDKRSDLNMIDMSYSGDSAGGQQETYNPIPSWVAPAIVIIAILIGQEIAKNKEKKRKEKQIVFNSGVTNDLQKYAKIAFVQRF